MVGSTEKRKTVGRPPKYAETRRPITVTLPERILRKLQVVSHDRCRAIVKCVEAVTGEGERPVKPVELVEVSPGKGLIVVRPSRLLKRIGWLRLVEIAPARYLLVLPTGTPVEVLEVAVHDAMDGLGQDEEDERPLLEDLCDLLRSQRRRKNVSKAELVFVDIPKHT